MRKNNLFAFLSIYLIQQIWQKRVGKKYNKKKGIICRFYPSCSAYGIRALKKYGFFKGWFLSIKRVKRCNLDNTDSCVDYP